MYYYMSHVMRKPADAICKQQRRISACASAQSDQYRCCSLVRWYSGSGVLFVNENETESKRKRNENAP